MKRVIIVSIGEATPGIAKALSEAFKLNHEILVKMLYNAPTVFLENADGELAQKSKSMLSELGLEVLVQDMSEEAPAPSAPVDIAIYIENPAQLTLVNKQLSEFLGCKESESLQLLLNEPSVVLGGVSMATAESLQKRLEAEVMASNPKTDLYTLEITEKDPSIRSAILSLLKDQKVVIQKDTEKWIKNITYEQLNTVLSRYRTQNGIRIYNQSFSRYTILLENFDLNSEAQTTFLKKEIGMPAESLAEIHDNLPVILDESVNYSILQKKLAIYQEAGIQCTEERIPFGKYKIAISNITDTEKTGELLEKFFSGIQIGETTQRWKAPLPLDSILSRFLEKQLEYIGCEIEHEY